MRNATMKLMIDQASKSKTAFGKTIAEWASEIGQVVVEAIATGKGAAEGVTSALRAALKAAGFNVEETSGVKSVTCTVTVKDKDGNVIFARGQSQAGKDEALLQACAAALREGK